MDTASLNKIIKIDKGSQSYEAKDLENMGVKPYIHTSGDGW